MLLASKLFLSLTLTLVGFMTIADDSFTTEEQLTSHLSDNINTFWQQGKFSTFAGVGDIRINYAFFTQNETSFSIDNKCLVVASGRSESYLKYKELSFDLFNQGYSIFLMDHRGQGL